MTHFHNLLIATIIVLIFGCLISACVSTEKKVPEKFLSSPLNTTSPEPSLPLHNQTISENGSVGILSDISGTGTVIYQNLEGGFYGVLADDGRRFLPNALPTEYRINGTRVYFIFRPVQDIVSISMWGESVDIISLSRENTNLSISIKKPVIEYEKAGGVTGSYELLRIFGDLRGEVTKWNQVQQFILEQSQLDNLTTLFEKSGFSSLKASYMPSSPLPDAITYTLIFGNHTIKTTAAEMPDRIKPIFSHLDSLLKQHTVSPIVLNTTLEGSTWNLISYTRSDGIPINFQNNTRISLQIEKNGVITGNSGCNQYSGRYNLSGSNLTFGPMTMTRMVCPDSQLMGIESEYINLLKEVTFVSGQERVLSMSNDHNVTILLFEQSSR